MTFNEYESKEIVELLEKGRSLGCCAVVFPQRLEHLVNPVEEDRAAFYILPLDEKDGND